MSFNPNHEDYLNKITVIAGGKKTGRTNIVRHIKKLH